MQETSSIDNPTHSSQEPSKSMASEETDGQPSTTALITNKKHSRPKIHTLEYLPSLAPVALTSPSSVLSTVPNSDIPRKSQGQLIIQESKSSTSNNSTENNIKENSSPAESISNSVPKKVMKRLIIQIPADFLNLFFQASI